MITLPPLDYALISPRHLQAALSRIPAGGNIADLRSAHSDSIRRADDSEDDDVDDDDNPADTPWWKKYDIWGDPLPKPYKADNGRMGALVSAVIPIKGVITSGYPTIFRAIGFADTEEIAGWIRDALNDHEVARIVLSIDSPGGIITGTPELAADVDRATQFKPVIAHTKGMMDSAAYWIASQADALYCTPSADVGCIGVFQMHYDWTGFLKDFGVEARMFKSGDLKGTGHPDVPMSEAQAARIQEQIAIIGAQFRAAVKMKRTLVEDDSMRGDSFIGTDAAARNLVAGLCPLEALL